MVEFASAVVGLVVVEWVRRRTDADERPSLTSPWVAAGALSSVAYARLTDADCWRIRTSRSRRLGVGVVRGLVRHRLFANRERPGQEFGIGELLGVALYRLRYGVLAAPPGPDD